MATMPLFPSLLIDVYKALKPERKLLKKESEFRTAVDRSYDTQSEISHRRVAAVL